MAMPLSGVFDWIMYSFMFVFICLNVDLVMWLDCRDDRLFIDVALSYIDLFD